MELRTARLTLRPATTADTDALISAAKDPAIARNLLAPLPQTKAAAAEFISTYQRELQEAGLGLWLAFPHGDDTLMGAVYLHTPKGSTAKLGYWANAAARGKGYLTEASEAVLQWAFGHLTHVHLQVAIDNVASIRLARRLGFTFHALLPAQHPRDGQMLPGWWATRAASDTPEVIDVAAGVDIDALVRQFHHVYGMHIGTGAPRGDHSDMAMRLRLIAEEFTELVAAVRGERAAAMIAEAFAAIDHGPVHADVVATADALGDLTYVIFGMAILMNIPLNAVISEIHRSNLTKLDANGAVLSRADGKVAKGPNYTPPRIKAILEQVKSDSARG